MNKNVKGLVSISMAALMAGGALFAKSVNVVPRPAVIDGDNIAKIEPIPEADSKKAPEAPEMDTITGKISVLEKNGSKILLIDTEDGKTYVLTNDMAPVKPQPMPPAPADDSKVKENDKGPKPVNPEMNNGDRPMPPEPPKGEFNPDDKDRPMPPEDMKKPDSDNRPEPPEMKKVSMDDLAAKKGKKSVTLSGFLNKESGVFTVVKIEDSNAKNDKAKVKTDSKKTTKADKKNKK